MSATTTHSVLDETRASLIEIAAKVSTKGATKSAQRAVRRWIVDGVTIRGAKVMLEAVRLGGKYVTSFEAYDRFLAACNAPPHRPVPQRSPAQVKRDSARAAKKLQQLLDRNRVGGRKPVALTEESK